MIITCYACHKSFVLTGWNPFRQTATCVTSSCGRHLHVGEAAERTYGPQVGRTVKTILESLNRVGHHGRESLDHLADVSLRRIEAVLKTAERDRVLSQGDVVAEVIKGKR